MRPGSPFGRRSSLGVAAAVSSSLRRGMLAATIVALSTASLAACGAGNHAQTLNMDPDNASLTQGDISVQNANVITAADNDDQAGISARLYNQGDKDQTLRAITLPGTGATVRLRAADGQGPVVVPAKGSVALGGKGNASAEISDASKIRLGDLQPVVFDLSRTGEIKLEVTVVPARHEYRDAGPSFAPSPEQSPSGSPSDSSSPSSSATPDGSPSATDGRNGAPDEPGAGEGRRDSRNTPHHPDASSRGEQSGEEQAAH